ncbi:hypothetical protein FHT76_006937 [Rhizobium sp. BK176]|nr:hypothetical protein [Rhizobium sp. BK181]MCS4095227.1 hypothetical protein [Rhizobium sp. BK176]
MTMSLPSRVDHPIISAHGNMPDWSMSGSLGFGCVGKITARIPFDERRLP